MGTPASFKKKKRQSVSYLRLFIIVIASALLPVLISEWHTLYRFALQLSPPKIEVMQSLRGIGITPVTLQFEMSDNGAGLDEVVVWADQEGMKREILRRKLKRRAKESVSLDLNVAKLGLKEGEVIIEIKVYGASWWHRGSEVLIPLMVDVQKPAIEILAEDSNLREGSSELIFYRARDTNLVNSGIKIGQSLVAPSSARSVDKVLPEGSILAALVPFPLGTKPDGVKLIAEDSVGNVSSILLSRNVSHQSSNTVYRPLSQSFFEENWKNLTEANGSKFLEFEKGTPLPQSGSGADVQKRQVAEFKFLNEKLREQHDEEIRIQASSVRFERYWNEVFIKPEGEIRSAYGDTILYTLNGNTVSSSTQLGYEIASPWTSTEVLAGNEGYVTFVGTLGVYGRVIMIDHGLGLVSLYGNLGNTNVMKGERVRRGQIIGNVGSSGVFTVGNLYFEMLINGVSVDPQGWWSSGWFDSQITAKVNNLKRKLGIPVS